MLTPAFAGVFGEPGDEGSADADGILHAANRLMDYHERFRALAERCRGLAAPSRYAGLLRDLAQLTDAPLAGYRTFINEFVERVGEMPDCCTTDAAQSNWIRCCYTWKPMTSCSSGSASNSIRFQRTRPHRRLGRW